MTRRWMALQPARPVGPGIEARVPAVVGTDDALVLAEGLSDLVPAASVDHLLEQPFVWIGTVDEIATKLLEATDVLGVCRHVIRPPATAPRTSPTGARLRDGPGHNVRG